MKVITLEDIQKARHQIQDVVLPTLLEHSNSCSKLLGTKTYLKFENKQLTGSFKIRGAMNKIKSLSKDELDRGIIAASAGNHAQGVAYSATSVGAKVKIVMPVNSPLVKVRATQGYGAEVILHGDSYDESYAHALELEKQHGYTFVHPYKDPMIIAGQGTIGLEVLEQIPDLDSIIVAVGGGGLVSGIGLAIKALRPECKVYGAVSEDFSGMTDLYHHRVVKPVSGKPTIADGIAVKKPSEEIFKNYISEYVDGIVEVSDSEISRAIVFLMERAKAVVEGSGAIGLAAALKADWDLGKKTCVLLCGGNIDLNIISRIIERGLSSGGRYANFKVIAPDKPGSLLAIARIISEQKANVLQVHHDRLGTELSLQETAIEFTVETNSQEHIEQIKQALTQAGFRVHN